MSETAIRVSALERTMERLEYRTGSSFVERVAGVLFILFGASQLAVGLSLPPVNWATAVGVFFAGLGMWMLLRRGFVLVDGEAKTLKHEWGLGVVLKHREHRASELESVEIAPVRATRNKMKCGVAVRTHGDRLVRVVAFWKRADAKREAERIAGALDLAIRDKSDTHGLKENPT